jgi:hypothetical protein
MGFIKMFPAAIRGKILEKEEMIFVGYTYLNLWQRQSIFQAQEILPVQYVKCSRFVPLISNLCHINSLKGKSY